MISAILLAAGESRRMGAQNKLLLPFKGKPLVRHVAEIICASDAGECIVIIGHEADRVEAKLFGLPVEFALNPNFAKGMTTSIQAGVRAADPNTSGLMICLSDLPLITTEDYNRLIQGFTSGIQIDSHLIQLPACEGKRGNPVIFSSHYREAILAHKEMEGCKGIVLANMDHVRLMEMPDARVLRDIDTVRDYDSLS